VRKVGERSFPAQTYTFAPFFFVQVLGCGYGTSPSACWAVEDVTDAPA
jgi:hypothetical protein